MNDFLCRLNLAMQFNEIEYRVKLETMLYQHTQRQALTKHELYQLVHEVKTYTEGLLGPFSVSVLPYFHSSNHICKLIIYVRPNQEKFNLQNDYYFDIFLKSG